MYAVLVILAFTTISLAKPTARQIPSGPCVHFAGGFDNATNFTLAALNRTLSNTNNTGAPLVLGQLGGISGVQFEALSTWASFPFNDWPSLSLVNGVLSGNMNPPSGDVTTSSGDVSDGSFVSFVTTSLNLAPAPVYCAVASTDPSGHSTGFPALALNGQTDLFSLCTIGTSLTAQNNVVYNATAENYGEYLFDSCYSVTLQLIGLPA